MSARGSMRAGPSHAFLRVLQGRLSPERYAQILRRAVRMRAGGGA